MYLIDESYFNRKLNVPNLGEINSPMSEVINEYIDDKVRLFLREVLGTKLFKELDSFIEDGELKTNAPTKWLNLVNGCYFTNGDHEYYFGGLLRQEGAFKSSMLANYTFYYWLVDNITQVTGVGEVALQGKNAVNVNSAPRLVSVWNEFVDYNQKGVLSHPIKYRHHGATVVDWLGGNQEADVSLQFFLNSSEDYKGHNGKHYKYINQFGL